MSEWKITTDQELRSRVRAETNYDDAPDELPQTTLNTLLKDAKLLVHSQTQSEQWYSDAGLGLTLLGVTCIKAKAHVENYSVARWDIGPTSIDVRNSDGKSIQMQQYTQMIDQGIANSTTASTSTTFAVTNSFIG